ncbi:MAG TPA: xanthine dehydrogenase family protein subunit M [Caulobacteraceae bacterium]|nr:xanthine dehydrogenase family protein subunit M [Caulobacteraceae bacterium]
MRPFAYERAGDVLDAAQRGAETAAGQVEARTQYLAGGTTLIDLMKLDVVTPERLVDITPLAARHAAIEAGPEGLRLGALARMSDAAEHPALTQGFPVLAQSLQLAASPQLRNMATLGGNVLQRTRCPYYRDRSWPACNKRSPGSGCQALKSFNRNHAVLGVDDSCIAQYPGDFGVALAALGAEVELVGPGRPRVIPFEALHRAAAGRPQIETTLAPGELITAFRVPAGPWSRRSLYLKIRDRASYEFAIASAAVALDLEGEVVREARIGLGGLAYRPWRSRPAEAALVGEPLTVEAAEAAAEAALAGAVTHGDNAYKPELGRRTLVRALMQAKAMAV